ncbi:hypothetical protein [Streptomyces indicus]|uniref:Uncharacterized protein n=1 Tax=Streptomyces indicus TaxID=417292 RepID=A0A1G9ETL7_9ACTN|nr:hypothetical protein [Streptomyces indicus]SDK79378.1 hypothetical protein SAMN05421806_11251 [Streptomyces indicus]
MDHNAEHITDSAHGPELVLIEDEASAYFNAPAAEPRTAELIEELHALARQMHRRIGPH